MKQQSGKPREVAPTELRHGLGCLRLCTPEEQQEMERSLRRMGQLQAVLVYRAAGGWEVIDGFKRVRAACVLEWAGIRVEELVRRSRSSSPDRREGSLKAAFRDGTGVCSPAPGSGYRLRASPPATCSLRGPDPAPLASPP